MMMVRSHYRIVKICIIIVLIVLVHTVARIGFLNTTINVNETSGYANLSVAVLGSTKLGREVTIHFSTADMSATGNGSL